MGMLAPLASVFWFYLRGQYCVQVIITDAASVQAVERKARLAGNGLRPCPEAQHRERPLSGSSAGSDSEYASVAVLAKGNGHSLRTAPRLESSRLLCIGGRWLDGILELHTDYTN